MVYFCGMKAYLIRLFEYECWANTRILKAIKQAPSTEEALVGRFVHILASQRIWYARIRNQPVNMDALNALPLSEAMELFARNAKDWDDFLQSVEPTLLSEKITYTNSSGQTYQSSIQDIVVHMVNHGSYHRGQIVSSLKGKIPSLPITDYIAFCRE